MSEERVLFKNGWPSATSADLQPEDKAETRTADLQPEDKAELPTADQ